MNYNISKTLVKTAVGNCQSISYPVSVTGKDFADDLADALNVISELCDKVRVLEKIIEDKGE